MLIAAQVARYSRVVDASEPARVVGDAVIAAFFSGDKPRAREEERQKVESWIAAELRPDWEKLKAKNSAFRANAGWRPFHWEIEFPEVFARGNPGFDAIVGNPPFLGGVNISGAFGSQYLSWLTSNYVEAGQWTDLVAYFFRRAYDLLRNDGIFGLIATNSIKQGDTRLGGLGRIVKRGGSITRAIARYKWPNLAAVVVSIVHVCKSSVYSSEKNLNGRDVTAINSYLVESKFEGEPFKLNAVTGVSFKGSDVLGMGFTFDDEKDPAVVTSIAKMNHILSASPTYQSAIFPFVGGEEINTDPRHLGHRYIINLSDLSETEARARYPLLMQIVEEKVRPERERLKNNAHGLRLKRFWWKFNFPKLELYNAIGKSSHVLAISQVTAHCAFARLKVGSIFAHTVVIFAYSILSPLAVLQSRVHEIWARFFSSSMKDDLRYAPSDCFETFPFPAGYETDAALEAASQTYHDHRAALMVAANEGMTKTYNRFHDPEERGAAIQTLRDLHDEIDLVVLRAYGWDDLADELRPVFLTEETEDDHTYQGRYFWPAEARDRVLARLARPQRRASCGRGCGRSRASRTGTSR